MLQEAPAESRKKLLCVEDNRQIAKLIAEELTERGFDVIIAQDGHEGFIAVLKGLPDLVLCDIGLPSMSGFEMLERLHALSPRLGDVPFVFVTALTGRENELWALRLGADHYITKPIDFEILETVVKARLQRAPPDETRNLAVLNDCEAETLAWAARGRTAAQIARTLGLTEQDVAFHLDHARAKLGAADVVASRGGAGAGGRTRHS
jgi:DNA-binding response OmpR family regulator